MRNHHFRIPKSRYHLCYYDKSKYLFFQCFLIKPRLDREFNKNNEIFYEIKIMINRVIIKKLTKKCDVKHFDSLFKYSI